MGKHAKRILSWVLALSLLMTCAISGLVLPTAAEDGNLIVNGDFEQGASVAWGNSAYVMDGVGVDGSKGYKIESTVNEGDAAKTLGAYYKEAFNSLLEPNTTYIVSFDYKNEGKGWGRFQVISGTYGSDWTGWVAKNNLSATEWTTVSFEFTTGAAENMKSNKGWEWKLERIHYANASNYGTGATYYDNIRVIKKPAAATSIALNKTAATVKVGATTTLTATATPDGAALPAITWKSSNEAVATVANGVVTGVAEGTATITATAEGLAPVTCTVTVEYDSNLFANGDFEGFAEATPVVAPWSYVANGGSQMNVGAVTAGVGVDGSYGLKLGTATGSIYVAFPSRVALEEGATYRLSWMAKSGTVSKAAVVMLNSAPNTVTANASSKSVYTKLSPTAGEWISYYMDIKANAGAYIHDVGGILIDVKAVDSAIVFDNFALTKIDEETDLILDGDFEKGSDASLYAETLGGSYTILSNANKTEIATAATADNANNRALKLKSGTAWTGGYFIGSHFIGGESYKVTMDYKGGSFRFYANPASHGSFNENKVNNVAFAASDEWKSIEFTFNFLTSGSNNWAFSFEKNSGNNTADTYIDNLKIVKIVESAPTATGIALDKTAVTLDVDATENLTVSVLPEGAAMPAITWTTSDAAVATVANGVVTAVGAGTATITATAAGLAPVTCTVTVNAPVADDNLIVNGNFEKGPTASWGNSAYIQEGVGKDGGWGVRIETSVSEGDSSKTTTMYYKESFNGALKPNTTYIFTFDYKHEGKGFGQLNVYKVPSDWTGWTTVTGLMATEWTTVTVEFTTGDAANMTDANKGWEWQPRHVQYNNPTDYGTGVVYFDNIKLVEKVVVPATEIQISPDKAKLEVGAEMTLGATVLPEGAEKPEIVWTTSDANIVKVENGKITAVAAGTATITATAGSLTDTCVVTVIEDDGNMIENGDLELGASVAWGNSNFVVNGAGKDGGYGLKIETSVAEGGASVWPGPYYKGEFNTLLKPNTKYIFSFDYKVEGKGFSRINVLKKGSDWTGWATLSNLTATEWTTVTMEFATGAEANMAAQTGWEWTAEHVQYSSTPGTGVGYFDNFKLVEKVVVPATGITLDKTVANLKPTQTTTLVVTAQPENAEPPVLEWKSSDDAVATVDATGKVTAVAAGTATITATANGTLTATCVVTVKADDGNMLINGDFTNGTDAWGRNDTEKGRIDAEAGKEGAGIKLETNITETTTAHQTPGVYYMDKFIALLEPDTIYTLSFDYKHEGMGFGQIVFNISPGKLESGADLKNIALTSGTVDWKTMTYTFSTPSAMPNANTTWEWQVRQVQYYDKGVGAGTTWFDNFKLVEVGKVVHADSIAIAPETLELFPNDSGTLAVTTSPIGASTGVITWASSDPTIVEVDQKGNVKALKASGEATITVTNDKGKTATAKVVITEYANVIANGDFEQGGASWGNIANIKPGIGKDGGYGIELTNESTSWTSYYYKGSLVGKMQPATTYIMSIDYYAPSNTSSVRMWSYKLGMTVSAGSFKTGKNEWQTVTKIFTTPTDMTLNAGWDLSFVCEETGGKPVVFDNFSIKKYSSGKEAESIVLNLGTMTIIPGRTGALTAHATPVDADLNDMTWTTSDANVAIVEYGVVTGVGKGTAVITGTTKNGKSASCTVTVSGNDVLVLNGNFDTEDDVWVLEGGATIAEGEGRVNSDGAAIVKDSTVKQVFKGLKADTQYQLFVSYRTASGKAAIKLQNGETVLLEGETGTSSLWTQLTFEFKTGETVEEDTVLTFTGLGNGPIYIDNVILAVKASLIDFTVSDVIWVGGGHQVKPGTELTFAVTVTNIGVDPVLAGQVIVIDLCKNGEVFQTLEYVCDAAVNTNDSVIVMATTPWAAVKGDWVVSARANPTLSILELDDTNNTKQVNLRVNETILEAPKEAADMDMTELTFSDEFESYDSIDMYATGKDGYKWYVTRSWGAGTVQPDSYTVKDGIISLHDQKPVFNITMGTVDAVTGVGWDYRYGYLETRLRIVYPERHEYAEGMSGGIPAIWSFPTDKWLERPGKNRQWVEMDWLEYWGKDTQRWPQYPDGYYTVTLHDQRQTEAGEQETWKVNSNSYQNGLGDGEWHVMGWLWAYNGVIAYIDGEEVFRITYSDNGVPSCKVRTNAGDQFDDIGAFSYMNEQELCLYIAGAYDKPLELDYVRIWQGGNAEVEAPDEEGGEEGGDVVVDIEAEDFWSNFCTDDYGDPIMEIDENNYRYIMMGAEYWDLLSEARKAEINEILKAAGQPSFEELVEAVEEFLAENPEAMAQVFIDTFFTDEEGNLITEATTDNYLQILLSAEVFTTLDKEVQLAIVALMGDYGMPAYEELLAQAIVIAEQEGMDSEDLPSIEDIVIPETGATSAWPMVAVLLILVSAAALWFSRKRQMNN